MLNYPPQPSRKGAEPVYPGGKACGTLDLIVWADAESVLMQPGSPLAVGLQPCGVTLCIGLDEFGHHLNVVGLRGCRRTLIGMSGRLGSLLGLSVGRVMLLVADNFTPD